jgi:hypothetical protein
MQPRCPHLLPVIGTPSTGSLWRGGCGGSVRCGGSGNLRGGGVGVFSAMSGGLGIWPRGCALSRRSTTAWSGGTGGAISTMSFYHIVSNANNYYGKVEQFMQSLYKINTALTNDNNKNLHIRTIILPKYYDYVKIFENANADKFPPHYPSDHTILLPEGFQPPCSPLYSSSYHS